MATFEKVAEIIAEKTGKEASEITREMSFADLGMDSLDTVDMLMGMEDEFGVTIELTEDIKCIDDVIKYIDAAGEGK